MNKDVNAWMKQTNGIILQRKTCCNGKKSHLITHHKNIFTRYAEYYHHLGSVKREYKLPFFSQAWPVHLRKIWWMRRNTSSIHYYNKQTLRQQANVAIIIPSNFTLQFDFRTKLLTTLQPTYKQPSQPNFLTTSVTKFTKKHIHPSSQKRNDDDTNQRTNISAK